jgi:hypothetical protein
MNKTEIIVRRASTPDELEEIRSFWVGLNCHPESDIDFMSMLGSVRQEILGPYHLVAYDNDEPVAMLVGRMEKAHANFKVAYLRIISIPLKQLVFVRDGFLGERSERVIRAMCEKIEIELTAGVADRALLKSLPCSISSNPIESIVCSVSRNFSSQIAPHWKTRLPVSFEAFLAKRPRKSRYHLRRIKRIFESEFAGKLSYEIFEHPVQVDAFCRAAETIARSTYQRGLGAGFIDNSENRCRLALMADKRQLRAYVVSIDDKPIAFWSGELVREVMYLTWTGFDVAYAKYEVGTILFLRMVDDLIEWQVKEIDYGLGSAEYKARFGDLFLQDRDLIIHPSTIRGYGLNTMCALEDIVKRAGERLFSGLKIKNWIKRAWRSAIAGRALARNVSKDLVS